MKERLEIDTRVNNTQKKNLEKALASTKRTGEVSQLELDLMRLATVETEIERDLSLGNYFVAYFRILNSMTLENLNVETVRNFKEALSYEHVLQIEDFKTKDREYYDQNKTEGLEPESGTVLKRVGEDSNNH